LSPELGAGQRFLMRWSHDFSGGLVGILTSGHQPAEYMFDHDLDVTSTPTLAPVTLEPFRAAQRQGGIFCRDGIRPSRASYQSMKNQTGFSLAIP